MNSKLLLLPFFLILFSAAHAQNPVHISVSNTTLAATDSVLPFWLAANQHGRIKPNGSFLNISELKASQNYNPEKTFGFTWGGHVLAAFGNTNYYQVNQAFAGLALKGWELKGGLFCNEIRYAGLSTSNGIIAQSQNARPLPRVRFSTPGYKSLPFFKKWFQFKGEYEEGFLNDERYVAGAHLHHKSLYGKIQTTDSWNFRIGFEHYVMWGGLSQDDKIGQMPESWNAYWHYVFALHGGKDFPVTDQDNIAGNQLGTYQLEFIKEFTRLTADFYLSHPWEDNSGLNWHNWPDNLLGVHLHLKNEKKWITDIVYEFTNSRQQSVRDSLYEYDDTSGQWIRVEYDGYYNHSIYRSGFTYQQQVMSSPLFFPVTVSDGISMGLQSNRLISHHIGARGNVAGFIQWKGLLTWIQHLGTWGKPYNEKQNQLSGLFEVQYINPGFPVELGLSLAADAGSNTGNNLGFQFSVVKRW